MLLNLKYSLLILLNLYLLLMLNQNYLVNILTIENIWIYSFTSMTLAGLLSGDSTLFSIALFSLCIAACEIVSLLTLYILDSSN